MGVMEFVNPVGPQVPGRRWSWEWFWFFPSRQTSLDPHAGVERRYHLLEGAFQLAVRAAARQSIVPIHLCYVCGPFVQIPSLSIFLTPRRSIYFPNTRISLS